ncbi:MAG TPA: lipoyl synthase [Nitrospiria bacterium]|nr:lipoyl synthase [Nitrospiria bacterium]
MPNRHFKTDPQPRTVRLPPWFKVRTGLGENYQKLRRLVTDLKLHTVCESAHCPNIWECWNAGTATFMILGNLCTRSCGFCTVPFGKPSELDLEEPRHVAEAVDAMGLTHAVITSVNRDELEDGGAGIFARTIREIRVQRPACTVEVLVPDFQGSRAALETVLAAKPDILAHNIETVPRLHPLVRPQARYKRSLQILRWAKEAGFLAKTGVMLGLGETADEVREVMADLVKIRCDIFTLGQYLQPSAKHLPVARFWTPEEFQQLKEDGEAMGIGHVEAGPLVRSSYHAERQAKKKNLI